MILNMGLGSHMMILVIGILKERTNIYIYIYTRIYIYIYISSTRQHTLQTKHDVIVSPNKECSQGPSTRIPKQTASLLLDKIIGPLVFKTLAAASSVRLKQKTWWTQSWKLCQWLMISLQYTKLPQTNYLKFGCLWMLMFTLLWMIHLYPFM